MWALHVVIICTFLTSCKGEVQEESNSYPEITCQSALDMLNAYFPFISDTPFIYINDQSGEQCRLLPAKWGAIDEFPELRSSSMMIDGKEQWSNAVTAFFYAKGKDGISDQRSELIGRINNSIASDKFKLDWSCSIWLTGDSGYYGYLSDRDCDSVQLWKYHSNTLTLPISKQLFPKTTWKTYDVPNAVMHIVKGHGLTDFSLDGQSTWRLVEKNP